MATGTLGEVIRRLGAAVSPGGGADPTDQELLECFVGRREHAALDVLVRRHAPMVWGVCRRVLGHTHDAEDAFQATFLVLVRRAATIRTTAGSWLYGVAHQTALKARATRSRRAARERPMAEGFEPAVAEPATGSDLRTLLDQELSRLPEKYRVVVVLCDLEAKSGREAARELGCPEGTLASRLSRGRAMLAKRLRRHGLVIPAGAWAALLPQTAASGGAPAAVTSAAVRAVTLAATGQATHGVSVTVVTLAEGVVTSMIRSKLTAASAAFLVGVLSVGAVAQTAPAPGSSVAGVPKPDGVPPAPGAKADNEAPKVGDVRLRSARSNPSIYMFAEQATSKIDPDAPRSFNLVITSARNEDGRPEDVVVRPGTMRVFRADAGVDEFTRQGGWYWRCGAVEGKSQFKAPGALIMVVRLHDGTIQWYSLVPDFRC
jgi:RNA polymerase sigma factor (sigma-70 family)